MCGIIGGNNFTDESSVTNGLQSMMHRGTDGNVIFSFENNMYISHNRLSIQDLSEEANQPMISEDGKFYLAFNGELWKPSFKKHWDRFGIVYTIYGTMLLFVVVIGLETKGII